MSWYFSAPLSPPIELFINTYMGGRVLIKRCRGKPAGQTALGGRMVVSSGVHPAWGLCREASNCGQNGRAVRVRASWVLIWAWGGVLPSRVGVLRELRYKGLWMALVGNKYRSENSIRDIHGRNQWRHAPPLSVYCLSGSTRTARVSKTRKLLFSAPTDLEPAVKCNRWLGSGRSSS